MNVQGPRGLLTGAEAKSRIMSRERFHDHPGAAAAGVLESVSAPAQSVAKRVRRVEKILVLNIFIVTPWLSVFFVVIGTAQVGATPQLPSRQRSRESTGDAPTCGRRGRGRTIRSSGERYGPLSSCPYLL